MFLVSLMPLAIGNALFRTSVTSVLTKCVPVQEVGTLSGALDGLDSLCRVVAPVISGVMMQYVKR